MNLLENKLRLSQLILWHLLADGSDRKKEDIRSKFHRGGPPCSKSRLLSYGLGLG